MFRILMLSASRENVSFPSIVNSTGLPEPNYHDRANGAPERVWLRLAFAPAAAIFKSMTLPDLTPEEYAEVVCLVRSAIEGDRYPFSSRVRRLRAILDKLEPSAPKPPPFPAPKASGQPSLVYAKLRGGPRRR